MSQRRAREGAARISRQKVIIERLKATGHDTQESELLLRTLEDTQKHLLQHLRKLMAERF